MISWNFNVDSLNEIINKLPGAQDFIPAADSLEGFRIDRDLLKRSQQKLVEYMKIYSKSYNENNPGAKGGWVSRDLEFPKLFTFNSSLPKFPNREFRNKFTDKINENLRHYKSTLSRYEKLESNVANAMSEGTLMSDIRDIKEGFDQYKAYSDSIPEEHWDWKEILKQYYSNLLQLMEKRNEKIQECNKIQAKSLELKLEIPEEFIDPNLDMYLFRHQSEFMEKMNRVLNIYFNKLREYRNSDQEISNIKSLNELMSRWFNA